jgi:parallel beta-helix repeat protein
MNSRFRLARSRPPSLCLQRFIVRLSSLVAHALPGTVLAVGLLQVGSASASCPPENCYQYEKEVCPSGCQYSTINAAISSFPTGTVGPIVVRTGTYLETINLKNRAGTCECPARIRADGDVTIDCRNAHTGAWTLYTGNIYYTSYISSVPDETQLFVNSDRYKYVQGSHFDSLTAKQYAYDPASGAERMYANFGGLNPATQAIAFSTRFFGAEMDSLSAYLTVEGFTMVGGRRQGIFLRGTPEHPVHDITIKGCTSKLNGREGMYLQYTDNCTVESSKAHDNSRHGIYLALSQNCQISRNESFRNIHPLIDGIQGNMAGIKIGEGADSSAITMVTVDYNVVHHNQDTGIALRGARKVLLRRNISYRNGDHGYDNDVTNQTVFMNNVAALNDHNGISVENTSHNVELYNNICAFNAIDGMTLASTSVEDIAEIWVGGTDGFASNNNVLYSYGPYTFANARSRALVVYAETSLNSLAPYRTASGQDAASRSSDPLFADTLNANFRVGGGESAALDRGKTDAAGWLSPWWLAVDPRGFVAHDVCDSAVADSGAGTVNYSDVGAYEFDPRPGRPSDVRVAAPPSTTEIWLAWTATRDDSTLGCKVDSADVRYSTSPITTEEEFQAADRSATVLVPITPNETNQQTLKVTGLTSCTQYHFAVKVRADENGLWSTLGDSTTASTSCGGGGGGCPHPPCEIDGAWSPCENPPCGGDPESRAAASKAEAADPPLALRLSSPNPSRGSIRVTWSIPRAKEGQLVDISLFDIAGRRVERIASGEAKYGVFEREVPFGSGTGRKLPNGVLFIRLRVGLDILHKAVVVSR